MPFFSKLALLFIPVLILLAVTGCAAAPGYQAAKLMQQQHEAGDVLMVQCRSGNAQACAFIAGGR